MIPRCVNLYGLLMMQETLLVMADIGRSTWSKS
jgi:hypothetical protein